MLIEISSEDLKLLFSCMNHYTYDLNKTLENPRTKTIYKVSTREQLRKLKNFEDKLIAGANEYAESIRKE